MTSSGTLLEVFSLAQAPWGVMYFRVFYTHLLSLGPEFCFCKRKTLMGIVLKCSMGMW